MGIHSNNRGTVQRQTNAHLDRRENGDIYGVFKLSFKKDSPKFEYCFLGEKMNQLTFDGQVIDKHPTFNGISSFEGWCRRYTAEHDT